MTHPSRHQRGPTRVAGLLSSTPFSASGKADPGAAAKASRPAVKVAKKLRKRRKVLTIRFRVRTDGRKARWSLERAVAKGKRPRFRRLRQGSIGAGKRLTRVVLRRSEKPGTKIHLRVAVRDSRGRVARTKALRITVPKR